MPNHKEKFLQTVLSHNRVLEQENEHQRSSIQTLQLEIQRLQSIIQSQVKSSEAKEDSLANMEHHLHVQVKDALVQRRILNEKTQSEQKLLKTLNDSKMELDSSQKQIIYLTKLLRFTNSDKSPGDSGKGKDLEFKSFVDLCLLLKVFSNNSGLNDNPINSDFNLDEHSLVDIRESIIKLQRINEGTLKELERLLNYCNDNLIDKSLHGHLKSVISLLLTSHVSVGFIYKDAGDQIQVKEEIDPLPHNGMHLGDQSLDLTNATLDIMSETPSLTTIENGDSFLHLSELNPFSATTSNTSRRLSEPIMYKAAVNFNQPSQQSQQPRQQYFHQYQLPPGNTGFMYTHLPPTMNEDINQLPSQFSEKVLLNGTNPVGFNGESVVGVDSILDDIDIDLGVGIPGR